jgi:hypothetical protein
MSESEQATIGLLAFMRLVLVLMRIAIFSVRIQRFTGYCWRKDI